MSLTGVGCALMALLMLLLALWVSRISKQTHIRERMLQHFREVLPDGTTLSGLGTDRQSVWQLFQARATIYAGFELRKMHMIVIMLVLLLAGTSGWLVYGMTGAVMIELIFLLVFGFLLPYGRLRQRQTITIAQVPLFIDQMLRSLSTGRSLESAIRFASDESQPPLKDVMHRVIRAADLGADMVDSLADAAKLHDVRELHLIALAMRISNNYGSSPRSMLESIVKMVRQQELARRELAAMTGETRVSAWALGMTPIVIAAYIMLMNPDYFNMLLEDSMGQNLMIIALCLQGLGAFILWRMLRSV